MPKAMTNLDTAFIEDLTAMVLYQKEKCEFLAELIDEPEAMQLLREIYIKAEKIRVSAINQRTYIRSNCYDR